MKKVEAVIGVDGKVCCKICGREFFRITNTHLAKHGISIERYKKKFPEAPIDAVGLADRRVRHLRGRPYEVIYGEEKAEKLKLKRKQSANKQFKDQRQRDLRSERQKGKEVTKETRKKISKANRKHGQTGVRDRALKHYGLVCRRCGKDFPKNKLIVHHKNQLNIATELGDHSLENLMVLCKPCHAKLHNELGKATGKFGGISNVEKGMHFILKGLSLEYGLDLTSEHFKDTPKRVARAYAEIFEGVKDTEKQVGEILGGAFSSESNEMIISRDIRVISMCPHHFLPVDYTISVAYIPNGQLLGISKLSRLVLLLARRPVIQEQLVDDITKSLMSIGCQGAGCVAIGKHYCMIMRGIKQTNASMVTTSLKGIFLESKVKLEFLDYIKMTQGSN